MKQKTGIKNTLKNETVTLLLVAIVVVIVYQSLNNAYLSAINIRTLLASASVCGVLAVGLTCLLISGQIDLSSASVGCLSAILLALMLNAGLPWYVSLLLVVLFGALTGLIVSFFVYVLKIPAFIATLALASIYQGFARFAAGNKTQAISDKAIWALGDTLFGILPIPFLIMAILLVIYGIILARTVVGRKIYVCGGNPSAARLAGLDLKKIHTVLFINCGALGAFAGCLMAARMQTASQNAVIGSDIDAITAIVLGGVAFTGGKGSMVGSFVGLMLLSCFKNGLIGLRAPTYSQIAAQGAILILALAADFLRQRALTKSMKHIRT